VVAVSGEAFWKTEGIVLKVQIRCANSGAILCAAPGKGDNTLLRPADVTFQSFVLPSFLQPDGRVPFCNSSLVPCLA
jgi:hypothetical protein